MSLKEMVEQVEKKTSFTFIFNTSVDLNQLIKANFKNESVDNVLKKAFDGRGISYEIVGSQIILKNVNAAPTSTTPAKPVKGVVKDEQGEPLIGATVKIVGTTTATLTDIDGAFTINVPVGSSLEVSYVSYTPQVVKITNQSSLDFVLSSSTKALDEVVVIGYGIQKKINLTGAVGVITSEDLQKRPITNISTGLQGLVPGMTVVGNANGGLPGQSSATIRVRGIGTIANSNPLVLIDGVEGDMNIINPNDVENISVLKDAASASIYGNRAANGVILITTKSIKGKDAKPQINFNGYIGFQKPTKMPEMADAATYIEWEMEANRNAGTNSAYNQGNIETVLSGSDPNYFANTDWVDALFRSSAPQQNYNVSINGKSNNMGYLISYGFLNQEGLLVGDAAKTKRHNIRLKLNTRVADFIDLDANIGYIDRNYAAPTGTLGSGEGAIYNAIRTNPLTPVRFTDGKWGYGGGQSNMVAVLNEGGSMVFESQEFTGNFAAKVDLLKGWTASANYTMRKSNSLREYLWKTIKYYYPETEDYWYATTPTNAYQNTDYTNLQQTIFAQTDYNLKIKDHSFHVMAGFQQEWNTSTTFNGRRDSLITEINPVLDFGSTKLQSTAGGGDQWAMRSGFGRINYNFKERYLFEANLRYDLTSRFIKKNRGGWFPSFSGAWRASEEEFLKNKFTWLDQLKIRASWGILGNQYSTSNNYPYISTIKTPSEKVTIGTVANDVYTEDYIGNPNLVWEKSYHNNIGLDVSVLNTRLNFTGDYYIRTTKGVVIAKYYPNQIGFGQINENAGSVENKGWEVQVSWNDKIGKDFHYGASFLLSDVKNKITEFSDPQNGAYYTKRVGHPIDALYGLVADGLAMPWDFEYYDTTTGKYKNPLFPVLPGDKELVQPGDVKFKDLDESGDIDLDKDRKVVGNQIPRYTFSFKGNLNYKGIDFSFLLQGVGKRDGYIIGPDRQAFTDQSTFPQKFHEGRYQASNPNPNAIYPRFIYNSNINSKNFSTFWMENAAYVRLKNVQLGYSLPQNIINPLRLSQCRFYVSADNLFTFTDFFSSCDPESAVQSGGNYPQVKTFVFGINFTLK